MKIGIEVQRLFRRKKHGMEIVALEIIRQLQQSKKNNQYILFVKNDEDSDCLVESKNFTRNTPGFAAFPIWEQLLLPRALQKVKPDILHCTSNTAPLFGKTPLIVTIHDVIYMEPLSFTGSSYQNFGNLYRRFLVPMIAKKAAIILTVSEYEKKVIGNKLKISEDKIRVIYNGVNKQFKPITDKESLKTFRAKYKLPQKFLLHFANTAPKKNTIGVLKMFKLYNEGETDPIPLVLTDCATDYISSLLQQIGAPGLINNIHILDYVPFGSVPHLINLASIFLYPSHRESFGMPVIEAMACGIPVITSNTSALPEIAGGAACLVDPLQPQEMYDQIVKLLSNGDLYSEISKKGLKNAERFCWENAADKIESIYDELIPVNIPLEHVAIVDRIYNFIKVHFSTLLVGFTNNVSKRH